MNIRHLTGDELWDHKRFPILSETDRTVTYYEYRIDDDTSKILYAAVSYEKDAPREVQDFAISRLHEKMRDVIRDYAIGKRKEQL